MKKFIFGILVGVAITLLIQYWGSIIWKDVLTPNFFQGILTICLAGLAGFIALCQVKTNVISSSRIKWIESFKHNVGEYITHTHMAIWNYKLYRENTDDKFFDKYQEALSQSTLHRNKLFMELNIKNKEHIPIHEKIIEINNTLDKLSASTDRQSLSHEVSKHQNELSDLVIQMLKKEWRKSKRVFQI